MCPYPESLERDPIHPSAYYCCVDGVDGQPLLLRMALASAPSSGLFPKAILIGRTHIGAAHAGARELVINVVPFGPNDRERILTFSEQLDKAFLPKTFGAKPVIRVRGDSPAAQFGPATEAFRSILKGTGQNAACFAASAGTDFAAFYFETVWALIRAGWREGYTIQAEPNTPEEVRDTAVYPRFGLHSPQLIPAIRETRRRSFDVEAIANPGDLESALASFKQAGCTAQSISLTSEPADLELADSIAQRFRAQLNLREVNLTGLTDRARIVDAFEGI